VIDFLQKLFKFEQVIGMLLTGQEYGRFQVFQPKLSILLNKNNENIDDNMDEYALPSNNIIIEED
jgi:hypothetical protein